MAVTDQQKLDFLLKKIGYTKTKTGSVVGTGAISGTPKQPFAEAIPSPLIIANGALWNEADSIPTTPPGADTNQVKVYLAATSGLRMTADATSSGQRAYIAYSTYGNTSSTRLTNWIDTQFGASYIIKVYKGDPNSGGVNLSAAGSGANDGWFFDYSAGVLNFNDTNVPSGVTDTNIYIVGYRYIGQTGAPTSGISTFSFKDLTVERNLDVGIQGGISTFRNNIDLNADLDVDGHTNLDNVSVTGVTTFTDDVYFDGATAGRDIIFDRSENKLNFNHNARAEFGQGSYNTQFKSDGVNFQLVHNPITAFYMYANTFQVVGAGNRSGNTYNNSLISVHNGVVKLGFELPNGGANYIDNIVTTEKGITVGTGVTIERNGQATFAGITTFASSIHVADSIIHEGDPNTQINFTNDVFEFRNNNVRRLWIQNGNNFLYGSNHFEATSSESKAGQYIARFRDTTGDDTVVHFHNTNVKNTVFRWNDYGSSSTAGNFVFTNLTGTEYARFTGSGNFNLLRDLDVDGHTNLDNISVAGVSTFTGDATFSGNVSIGGTLTYEDVTNVDSVGLLTARSGIRVTGGIIEAQAGENKIPSLYANYSDLPNAGSYHGMFAHVHATGRGYFAHAGNWLELVNADTTGRVGTGTESYFIDRLVSTSTTATSLNVTGVTTAVTVDINGDLDVDGHTNLDNVSVAGVSTFSDNLKIIDDKKIIVGNGLPGVNDLEIFHQSSNNYNYIKSPARGFIIQNGGNSATYIAANYFNLTNANFSQTYATANNYGINLRYNNDQKLRTASSGIEVIGVTTTTGLAVTGVSTFTGNIDANGDLDVDGHTNLDNLDVVGVATFTGSKFNIESTGESFVKRTGGGGGAIALIVSGDQNGQPLIEFRHGGSGIGQIKKIGTSGLRFTSDTLALRSHSGGGESYLEAVKDGAVELFFDNVKRFETTNTGINVTGNVVSDGLVVDGNADLNGDLDVDGHTNLDNINIVGVTTTTDDIHIGTRTHTANSSTALKNIHMGSEFWNGTAGDHRALKLILYGPSGSAAQYGLGVSNSTLELQSNSHIAFFAGGVSGNTKTRRFYITSGGDYLFDSGTLYVQDKIGHYNDANTNIRFPLNDTISFETAGSERLRITHEGNISVTNDLDVDGHTNLDNVSIAGVSTFATTAEFDGTAKFDSTITAGGGTGTNGQYLKTTGSGVEWATFPSLRTRQTFTASAGQTTFTFNYTVTFLDVFVNGIKLTDAEFTATNGTSVVLSVGCFVGDIVELVSYNTVSAGGGASGIGNVVEDTTPQLGGNLDLFSKTINGTGGISITGVVTATTFIGDGSGLTGIVASGSGVVVKNSGSTVGTAGTINFGDNLSVSPISAGIVTITGSAGITTAEVRANTLSVIGISTFTGNIDANGDLDVDGHTNLDNVSVAGVVTATTFVGALTGNATGLSGNPSINLTDLDVDGHTNLDNVSIAGVVTATTFKGALEATSASFSSNIDANGDLDVDGHTNLDNVSIAGVTTMSGNLIISNTQPKISLVDTNNNPDYDIMNADGIFQVTDATNSTNRFRIDGTGTVNITGNLDVGAGVDVTGNTTVTGDLDVDGHTNLDNISVAGVSTFANTVDLTNGTLKRSSTGNQLIFYADNETRFYHTSNALVKLTLYGTGEALRGSIEGNASQIQIKDSGGRSGLLITHGAESRLYFNDVEKFRTTNTGAVVSGILTATSFSGSATGLTNIPSAQLTGALPSLDGSALTGITASGSGVVVKHDGSTVGTAGTINFSTNLDVSAISAGIVTVTASGGGGSGISTISGVVNIANDLHVDGHTELDNVNVVGLVTITNSASGIGLKLIDSSSKQFAAGGGGSASPFAGSLTGHDFRIQVGGLQNAIFKYAAGATGNLELGPASGIGITFNGSTGNAGYAGIITATKFVGDGSGLTGVADNVGITTNLSGSFTASAGSPSTINTFGYGGGDIVVEYTVFIKNGSNYQSQKLLAMRDGTTIHSTQFAIMYSSSLLVQLDATISSGNILLRATPETGVSGDTTYKIKREVM